MVSHIDAIRDLQALGRKYPDVRERCDEVIEAIIILADKRRKYEAGK
jgi:hypothetical protein